MSSDYSYKNSIDDNSNAKLEITVTESYFQKAKDNAYSTLAPQVKLKGFRPGMAPKNLIEAQLGPQLIEQALNRILPKVTADIINELKLEPITQVEYKVEKLDPGQGIEFSATFAVLPQIKLADPKKIKVDKESAEIKDADVDQVLKNMAEDTQKNDHNHEGHDHDHDHNHEDGKTDEEADKKTKNTKKEEVKIDDKWVESLKLENIKTLDALKVEIRKTLENQRQTVVEEKYNLDLLGELVKLSNIRVPQGLLDLELDARQQSYVNRITSLGLKIDDFLRNQNTTLEKLRESWKDDSEKKLAIELVLLQIAKDNNFSVSDEEVEKEIASISDEKMRNDYNTPSGKAHIRSILGRQKSIEWLKSQVKS